MAKHKRISINGMDISMLPCDYLIGPIDAEKRRIRMSSIIPTQADVLLRVVRHYMKQKRNLDRDGNLPFGIRFAGSRKVYLIDGHHRWYAQVLKKKVNFYLWVEDYEETFEEACGLIFILSA